ncbi:hypothetical protein IFM89_007478 [Coptis chinensis]|uniref:cyclin-dependent kinase n=1 Tax=Coptis chinensis TaxID=261450 RepID=A0A835HBS8_9MAGN|nr:hypothetical protein IFM89_007478 [Coptis chinensis]
MDKYTSTKLEKVGHIRKSVQGSGQDDRVNWWPSRRRCWKWTEEGVPLTALSRLPSFGCSLESLSGPIALRRKHADNKNGKPLLYLVFEYLDTDLIRASSTNCAKGGPLPIATCFFRDLKPQNLLVDKDKGILKIADLGLGRAFTVPLKSYTHEVIVTLQCELERLRSTHYSMRCRSEMVRDKPYFPGDSEMQQLLHIFRLLGTPSEDQWPGVSSLRDWHEYPQWKPQNLARAVPNLEPEGVDLLSVISGALSCKLHF